MVNNGIVATFTANGQVVFIAQIQQFMVATVFHRNAGRYIFSHMLHYVVKRALHCSEVSGSVIINCQLTTAWLGGFGGEIPVTAFTQANKVDAIKFSASDHAIANHHIIGLAVFQYAVVGFDGQGIATDGQCVRINPTDPRLTRIPQGINIASDIDCID